MYTVVIVQDGDTARLECETFEEALDVRRSFVNYGKCQEITIEMPKNVEEDVKSP